MIVRMQEIETRPGSALSSETRQLSSISLRQRAHRSLDRSLYTMAPQELASLYSQLKTEFSKPSPDLAKCGTLLSKLKVFRMLFRI